MIKVYGYEINNEEKKLFKFWTEKKWNIKNLNIKKIKTQFWIKSIINKTQTKL